MDWDQTITLWIGILFISLSNDPKKLSSYLHDSASKNQSNQNHAIIKSYYQTYLAHYIPMYVAWKNDWQSEFDVFVGSIENVAKSWTDSNSLTKTQS